MAAGVILNVLLCVTPLSAAFGLVKLDAAQWGLAFGAGLAVLPVGELYKLGLRFFTKRKLRYLRHSMGLKAKNRV